MNNNTLDEELALSILEATIDGRISDRVGEGLIKYLDPNKELPKIGPRPLPNPLPPVMPFNPEMLPKALREFVMDVAGRLQGPPDFIAVSAICGLSALLGHQVLICPKQNDNWLVIPNLWAAIIGRPSAMKSPTMKAALQLLYLFEKEFSKQYADEKKIYDKEQTLHDLDQKIKQQKAKKALAQGKRSIALKELDNDFPIMPPPSRKRLIVNDATVEKLGELLSANPNGLLLVRDELSGWLSKMEQEEYHADRSFYIECFDGDGKYTYDRIVRGTVDIANCTLSIIGGIQPSRIAPLIRNAKSGTSDDGLIQRLQLSVWPDECKDWKWVDQTQNTDAFGQYAKIFHDFLNLRKQDGNLPDFLRFTPEAQELYIEWMNEIQSTARSKDTHSALASHLLKMPATVASLALIFELINDGRQAVGIEAIVMALEWADYLISHAKRLYSLGRNNGVDGAHIILKRKGQLKSPFKAREVGEKDWTSLGSMDLVNEALQCLVDYGYLSVTKISTTNAGGRPTLEYHWIEYKETS